MAVPIAGRVYKSHCIKQIQLNRTWFGSNNTESTLMNQKCVFDPTGFEWRDIVS